MAKSRKFTVSAVSDGSGDGTFYTPYVTGYIETVEYVKPGSGSYTDGVDFTIRTETTGEDIWVDTNINASEVVRPRAATCTTAGVAALYAASGAVNDRIAVSRDRVKIIIGSAGATKSGSFVIVVADA